MDEGDLIGFWSHETLYLSSMQDDWLYFGQRGEGAYAYLRLSRPVENWATSAG